MVTNLYSSFKKETKTYVKLGDVILPEDEYKLEGDKITFLKHMGTVDKVTIIKERHVPVSTTTLFINGGAWLAKGNVLNYNEDGSFQLSRTVEDE